LKEVPKESRLFGCQNLFATLPNKKERKSNGPHSAGLKYEN